MNPEAQSIDNLKTRYEDLNEKRIQSETKLEEAKRQLKQFQKQAIDEFGTDDLDELEKKLEVMKAENEKKRAEFQTQLDDIEEKLAEIETGTETD